MTVTSAQLATLRPWPHLGWQRSLQLAAAPSGDWRSWLNEPGSLTLRLQSHASQSFSVRILSEGVQPISREERSLLNTRTPRIWVRQVLLEVDGEPWVFARSLLPLNKQGQLIHRLTHLGNQPLGHLLFKDPTIQRGDFLFCRPHRLPFASLWGRASCFESEDLRLLVAEHFLPPMAQKLGLPHPAWESAHE